MTRDELELCLKRQEAARAATHAATAPQKEILEVWYWVYPTGYTRPVAAYNTRHVAERHLALFYPRHGGAVKEGAVTYSADGAQ